MTETERQEVMRGAQPCIAQSERRCTLVLPSPRYVGTGPVPACLVVLNLSLDVQYTITSCQSFVSFTPLAESAHPVFPHLVLGYFQLYFCLLADEYLSLNVRTNLVETKDKEF